MWYKVIVFKTSHCQNNECSNLFRTHRETGSQAAKIPETISFIGIQTGYTPTGGDPLIGQLLSARFLLTAGPQMDMDRLTAGPQMDMDRVSFSPAGRTLRRHDRAGGAW